MYEVPHANGQNFNSMNYPDWGTTPFNESRRRNARGKPHHQNRRNHQQAAWSEHGPAPASPQWQPQAPPVVVDTNFAGFQEPQGPVACNLSGLPSALCRQNFLEAMLDQAGLANDIMGCNLGEEQDLGKAVIYLANYNAAVKCMQHFGGRRWDNAGPPVAAHLDEVVVTPAANAPPARAANPRARKVRGAKNGQEQMNMFQAPGAWAMPQAALPLMAFQHYQKGSELSPETAGGDSPNAGSTGSTSPNSKKKWADLTDEEEKENDLSEGLEGSTSAGSTGPRNSNDNTAEGFSFFGCDVDTDDGF
jgi:hypothetical protein